MSWPDWFKYKHSPIIYGFDYGEYDERQCNFKGGRGFLWEYPEDGFYVVLPQYPKLRSVK